MLTGDIPFKASNAKALMDRILHDELEIPLDFSIEVKDLLSKLLRKDPKKRLASAKNIKEHAFYHSIDWKMVVHNKELPIIKDNEVMYEEVLDGKLIDSSDSDGGENYKGFSYAGSILDDLEEEN